jgi:plastocyanin domain-containing protein
MSKFIASTVPSTVMTAVLVIALFMVLAVPVNAAGKSTPGETGPVDITMKVTVAGFEPSNVEIPEKRAVRLLVTRTTDATCAKDLVIPSLNSKTKLPLNQEVVIKLPAQKPGQFVFGCAMSLMIGGVMVVKPH